ncbi:MAG: SDR family NAD(P)-dependent oxidoreductase, partial [Hyphomicrobiales bacterium]|nr:SDR family NAD(P)-dependent oxidoreductase [Hyphomicrobiales bacterium]
MPDERPSIVIFGGARGIGAAVARRFAADGYRVIVGDVLEDEGRALEAENADGSVKFVRCDVADGAEIDRVFDQALEQAGKVDVVFNNVGIVRYGEVDVLSLEDWDYTLGVNLTAQFL